MSHNIRRIIDGQDIDIRVSEEGVWNILRNDIHILAKLKNEQVGVLEQDKIMLKDTPADIEIDSGRNNVGAIFFVEIL